MFKENLIDIKILIVEDEKNISNAEKKYLEVEGFEVDQAFDGQEAIDMINTTDYSLNKYLWSTSWSRGTLVNKTSTFPKEFICQLERQCPQPSTQGLPINKSPTNMSHNAT